MTVIELEYDAKRGVFKPLEPEAKELFEHGELYLAIISDSGTDTDLEPIDFRYVSMAHA